MAQEPVAGDADRALAHARLGRVVLAVNFAAGLVAVVLLVAALYTGYVNQEQVVREKVAESTQVRATYLSRHLALLSAELRRLGLRSEVDLFDENSEPERSLLQLSHSKSTFFDVGVAIVDPKGSVVWSEPQKFLSPGFSLAKAPWFDTVRESRNLLYVPVRPETEHSLIYVVSPIIRSGLFAGVLLGAIDLAKGGDLEAGDFSDVTTLVLGRNGVVVYPPAQPDFVGEPAWGQILRHTEAEPFLLELPLGGQTSLIASAPVAGSDFSLLSVVNADTLDAPARKRFTARLGLGLAFAMIPNLLLLLILRSYLRNFRTSEEDAVRDERLKLLGEAANLIAHEIKNALNGLRMGIDVVLAGGARDAAGPTTDRRKQAVNTLRTEIERLSAFTSELLIFSRGIVPRPIVMDLANLVPKVAELAEKNAEDLGVELEVLTPPDEVKVRADPSLIHVVVTNLVGNALESLAGSDVKAPRVTVAVGHSGVLATVRVHDNGPGVDRAVLRKLFEPFVTGKPNGVGIGLALSRKIARAHGGDLILERPGPGASFLLSLPMATAET